MRDNRRISNTSEFFNSRLADLGVPNRLGSVNPETGENDVDAFLAKRAARKRKEAQEREIEGEFTEMQANEVGPAKQIEEGNAEKYYGAPRHRQNNVRQAALEQPKSGADGHDGAGFSGEYNQGSADQHSTASVNAADGGGSGNDSGGSSSSGSSNSDESGKEKKLSRYETRAFMANHARPGILTGALDGALEGLTGKNMHFSETSQDLRTQRHVNKAVKKAKAEDDPNWERYLPKRMKGESIQYRDARFDDKTKKLKDKDKNRTTVE